MPAEQSHESTSASAAFNTAASNASTLNQSFSQPQPSPTHGGGNVSPLVQPLSSAEQGPDVPSAMVRLLHVDERTLIMSAVSDRDRRLLRLMVGGLVHMKPDGC